MQGDGHTFDCWWQELPERRKTLELGLGFQPLPFCTICVLYPVVNYLSKYNYLQNKTLRAICLLLTNHIWKGSLGVGSAELILFWFCLCFWSLKKNHYKTDTGDLLSHETGKEGGQRWRQRRREKREGNKGELGILIRKHLLQRAM